MKKLITLLTIAILISSVSVAQEKRLQAYLLFSTFNSPNDGPYVETYLSVVGNSVIFKQLENGKYQGEIEVTMIFKDKSDAVANYGKYTLSSPELEDTTAVMVDFLDIQRFTLDNGDYDYELMIKDQNSARHPVLVTQKVSLDFPAEDVSISGIELVDKYKKTTKINQISKSGYDLTPRVSNFYPETKQNISFYGEVYNLDKKIGENQKFLVKSYLSSFESGEALNKFVSIKRMESKPVVPILNNFNIEKLPTGNYYLNIDVIDKENNILTSRKAFFQRSNSNLQFDVNELATMQIGQNFTDLIPTEDSLRMALRSLEPISSSMENDFIKHQLKNADMDLLKKYFYHFWLEKAPADPEGKWNRYAEEVRKAEEAFGTGAKKGFETDRGRIYLKYGAPNSILESYNEPKSYPFEIWQYYVLGNQRNKRLLFYTTNIASNDFRLLHSDVVGEINNPEWKQELLSRNFYESQGNSDNYNNIELGTGTWGSNLEDLWNQSK